MQSPDTSKDYIHESKIVLAEHHNSPSRFQKWKEKASFLSKHKYTQLGLILLLVIAVPLTVIQGFRQQITEQQAASKPEEDWTKCPVLAYGQPGTLDVDSAIKGENDFNNANPKDPTARFGKYFPSTDPADPYFTDAEANGEGRWAGDGRRDAGTPYYHGGPFRADAEGGNGTGKAYRVGGFGYLGYNDTHLLDLSGHEHSQSNWNTVMRWTEDFLTGSGDAGSASPIKVDGKEIRPAKGGWYGTNNPNLDKKGKFINRNCVLNTQIFRLWNSYKLSGKGDLFGYAEFNTPKGNDNAGFYIRSGGVASVSTGGATVPGTTNSTTSGDTGGLRDVVNTPTADAASCTDKLSFTDVADPEIKTAISCLGTKAACTVRGFVEGNFGPNETLTRGQFYAFLARYHVYVIGDWKPVDLSTLKDTELFTDIPIKYSSALEIYTAVKNGFNDSIIGKPFQPNEKWTAGFTGFDAKDYDFNKLNLTASMTRGELMKKMYAAMSPADKTKACNGGGSSTPSQTTPGKNPEPFSEGSEDTTAREAVCKKSSNVTISLLNGFITGIPTAAVYKDAIFLFARGRENELYFRKIKPANGPISKSDLSANQWVNLGKKISSTNLILAYADKDGTLFVIANVSDGDKQTVMHRSTTTGDTWTDWSSNQLTDYNVTREDHDAVASIGPYTYSFVAGQGNNVANNVCMSTAAVPGVGTAGGAPGGGQTPGSKPSTSGNGPKTSLDVLGFMQGVPLDGQYTATAHPTAGGADISQKTDEYQRFEFDDLAPGEYLITVETPSGYTKTFPPNGYTVKVGPNCSINPMRTDNYHKTACGDTTGATGLEFDFQKNGGTQSAPVTYSSATACRDAKKIAISTMGSVPNSDDYLVNECCTSTNITLTDRSACPADTAPVPDRTGGTQPGFFQQVGGAISAGLKAIGDGLHALNPFD